MNRVTATGLGADERRWAEECIDALDANPEEALNAYCHEGLDVRPGHRVDDDGNAYYVLENVIGCGHGAGFWDRGLGEVGDALSKACEPYGSVDLYVGDDGKIYG